MRQVKTGNPMDVELSQYTCDVLTRWIKETYKRGDNMKTKWVWVTPLCLLAALLAGPGVGHADRGNVANVGELPSLVLVREARIVKLGKDFKKDEEKLEASGVVMMGDYFYVVFDDHDRLGRIHHTLKKRNPQTDEDWGGFYCDETKISSLEGITTVVDDQGGTRLLIVEEYNDNGSGATPGRVSIGCSSTSPTWQPAKEVFVPTRLGLGLRASKGFEGIAFLKRNEKRFLLILCEGNRCAYSTKPDDGNPYDGQILVYEMIASGADGKDFELIYRNRIRLHGIVDFADYSGISVAPDGRIGVVSQTDEKLWLGKLTGTAGWKVTPGMTYRFPMDVEQQNNSQRIDCGNTVGPHAYGNIEGLFFVNNSEIVVVSDEAKKKNSEGQCKEMSIHIFKLPSS